MDDKPDREARPRDAVSSAAQPIAIDRENLSAAYRREAPAERKLQFRTAKEIAQQTPSQVPWIAEPWVATGAVTQVVGKPKTSGKTTWILHMSRAVLEGTEFMGHATAKTAVVYLTEERQTTFREALRRAGLLDHDDLIVLQWSQTLGVPWEQVVRASVEECERRDAKLLVIDTVSQFVASPGDTENDSGEAFRAYRPLQQAAAEGLAVIAVRHERKSGGDVSNAGRGSSAFAGAVDCVVSIRRPEGTTRHTVREIRAVSRFNDTPDRLIIELTKQGYVAHGSNAAFEFDQAAAAILGASPTSKRKAMDVDTIIRQANVPRTTTQEVLKKLTGNGQMRRVGAGKKGDAYRYFRPQIHSAEAHTLGAAQRKKAASLRVSDAL